MAIYGPSLSVNKGSSVLALHLGCFPTSSNNYLTGSVSGSITCNRPSRASCRSYGLTFAGFLSAAAVIASGAAADTIQQPETLSNIPQTLSGECISAKDCKKAKIQRPKSRKAESCTIKCVTTCIRGGEGSPGEGPFNVRRYTLIISQAYGHFRILWF